MDIFNNGSMFLGKWQHFSLVPAIFLVWTAGRRVIVAIFYGKQFKSKNSNHFTFPLYFHDSFEDSHVVVPSFQTLDDAAPTRYSFVKSPAHIAKFVIIFIMIITCLCNLVFQFAQERESSFLGFFPSICLLTFSLAFVLHISSFNESASASADLCVFWMLELTCVVLSITWTASYVRDLYVYGTCAFFVLILENFPKYSDNSLVAMSVPTEASDAFPKMPSSTILVDCSSSPENSANFFSRLLFSWLSPLLKRSIRSPLSHKDLFDIPQKDYSSAIAYNFNEYWSLSSSHKQRSFRYLVWSLLRAFGGPFFLAALLKIGHDCLNLIQPLLLKRLIEAILRSQRPALLSVDNTLSLHNTPVVSMYKSNEGYTVAFTMFFASIIQTVFLQQYFYRCFLTGMRLKSALVSAIYVKSLRLSNTSRQRAPAGEIVNHMAIDAQRVMDVCGYFNIIWSGPFQIITAIVLLYRTLGMSVFAGVVVMILSMPLNGYLSTWNRQLEKKQMANKDARMKIISDILNGIRTIKLYAWENSFLSKVLHVRNEEMKTLKKLGLLSSTTTFLWVCTPMLVSVASFACYVLVAGETLTSSKAFVSLSLFNILQMPMSTLPSLSSSLMEAHISLQRIHKFLCSEEFSSDSVNRLSEPIDGNVVHFINAEISWSNAFSRVETDTGRANDCTIGFQLKNIDFAVKAGNLVSIVGPVGSGKSSLVSALLGELNILSGSLSVHGRIAYVPQHPWILHATLRDNILFGRPYDPHRYQQIIEACQLVADLEVLPEGDLTEIGENGINLSGGQKQRVNLARAVYSDADLYLMDDPLSAVDVHVGRHLFYRVLNGLLKQKTRILTTNQLQYLKYSDSILILKGGSIVEQGSYDELLRKEKGELANLMFHYAKERQNETPKASLDSIIDEFQVDTMFHGKDSEKDEKGKLQNEKEKNNNTVDEAKTAASAQLVASPAIVSSPRTSLTLREDTTTGSVDTRVYKRYLRAMGIFPLVILLLAYVLAQGTSLSANLWLAAWSSLEEQTIKDSSSSVTYYLSIYVALAASQSALVFLQAYTLYTVCGVRSAAHLHKQMLTQVLRAPISFFDTTPNGRILNRFSKDVNTVDDVLPKAFQSYLRMLFIVLSILLVIGWSTPWFILAVLPLGYVYHQVQSFYVASSRELKRLDSTTRSPIYAHFSETLQGTSTIRAYAQQRRFIAENARRLDDNQRPYYLTIAANRWLAMRLEMMGSCVVLLAALFAVAKRHQLTPGVAGLSLTYALSLTQALNWLVRQSCEIESHIISVERICEYCGIDTEAPELIDRGLASNWPNRGEVIFDKYSTRYRSNTPLVLKDVSFSVRPKEKLGVCGRTGAGKSSLTLALFRMIEAETGSIVVDGEVTRDLGLQDLRQRLTIIPQDSVLFSGTVRENIDPFSQYSNESLWHALQCAHLDTYILSLPGQLEAMVAPNGENMSAGQRQLLSLTRALLRKNVILVLDEATAAVDVETDSLVQTTIRQQFSDSTMITIAHRLHTIIDSDRILVLDKGQVVELDTPSALLSRPDSIFYQMAKDARLI